MGNKKDLKQSIQETEKFITKKGRMYQIEKIIIDLFKKIIDTDNNSINKTYRNSQKSLSIAAKEKYAANIDEFDHFNWWIESKLKNKSIGKLVKTATQYD